MEIRLNQRPIHLSDVIPPGWEQYHLPRARRQAWEDSAGLIFVQTVQLQNHYFKHLMITPGGHHSLCIDSKAEGLNALIALRGNWELNNKSGTSCRLKTTEACICWGTRMLLYTMTEPGSDIILLNICFRAVEALQWVHHENPFQRTGQMGPQVLNLAALDLIDQLLHGNDQRDLQSVRAKISWHILREIYLSFEKSADPYFLLGQIIVEQVQKVKAHMDQHPESHLSLSALAGMAGMNRQKLQDTFKKLFGVSIYTYDLQNRMSIAQQVLKTTNNPIKQIAKQCRYKNLSSFTAAFAKYTGLTPTQYRRLKT